MRDAIIELAGDRRVFDSRSRWLDRAARVAGISQRMAKSLFYCESTNPSSAVVDAVRAARRKATKDAQAATVAQDEYAELLARISRLEEAIRLSGAVAGGGGRDARRGDGG
jgi:hypothetical protein